MGLFLSERCAVTARFERLDQRICYSYLIERNYELPIEVLDKHEKPQALDFIEE